MTPFLRTPETPGKWRLIVGLGNPGPEYASSRHNVGFQVVRVLAKRRGLEFGGSRSKSRIAQGAILGQPVVLARPQTYMNLSGQAVKALAQWLRIGPAQIIVVYDDLDLPVGRIRLRPSGSAGGHRGMASIIASLGSQDLVRVRIGIGRPNGGGGGVQNDAIDHVLGPFSPDERRTMDEAYVRAAEALECILLEGLEAAMNRFNVEPAAKPPVPKPARTVDGAQAGSQHDLTSKERPDDVVP